VIGTVSPFLVSWLLTWALLMVVYLGLLAAVDRLRTPWRSCQRARQYRRATAGEIARIDREASESALRIVVHMRKN